MSLLTLLTGNPATGALRTVADDTVGKVIGKVVGSAAGAVAETGLDAIASWVLDGTKSALEQVAQLISAATSPDLTAAWFSATYWRVAGLAGLLTVPFIFAAMVQAILRSDLALIGKVVFTYLPVSVLSVSLAAPVVMLLLSATDQMCRVVSSAAVTDGAVFLDRAGAVAGGLSTLGGSPFFAVMVGLFAVAAALMLALELMIREAAVYVVVLMLPLAFAAFVWPARRIWALRLVELLISLILSKFVIVAVLSLAGSALGSGQLGISRLLTATALLLLSTFAPWALLRILPFTELAAGAAGALRHELPAAARSAASAGGAAAGGAGAAAELAMALPARLRRHADQAGQTGQDHIRDDETGSGHLRHDVPGPPARQPQDLSGRNGGDPPAGGAAEPRGDHGASRAETSARSEPLPASEGRPLAHIRSGTRLDLSAGVWIEPDDDE